MNARTSRGRQRGVTLIVALIMLVAISMLAIWSFNSSTANTRIVGNTQARQEAVAAAQAAIERTISSAKFITDAAAVAAGAIDIDIDDDAVSDFAVRLSPQQSCYSVRVVKQNELDPTSASAVSCLGSSVAHAAGVEVVGAAAPSGDSLCADSHWNIRAVVNDPRSNASVAVNQGVAVRSLSTDTTTVCP